MVFTGSILNFTSRVLACFHIRVSYLHSRIKFQSNRYSSSATDFECVFLFAIFGLVQVIKNMITADTGHQFLIHFVYACRAFLRFDGTVDHRCHSFCIRSVYIGIG